MVTPKDHLDAHLTSAGVDEAVGNINSMAYLD